MMVAPGSSFATVRFVGGPSRWNVRRPSMGLLARVVVECVEQTKADAKDCPLAMKGDGRSEERDESERQVSINGAGRRRRFHCLG